MEKIDETISDYFKDNQEVVAVYLFGSYAAGKQRHLSDVDIGIILDRNVMGKNQMAEKRQTYMIELSRILRKDIHLVILNTAGEGLLYQVLRKGKCVLVNNRRKLTSTKAIMLSMIADFNYHKTMMQTNFVRNVMELAKNG